MFHPSSAADTKRRCSSSTQCSVNNILWGEYSLLIGPLTSILSSDWLKVSTSSVRKLGTRILCLWKDFLKTRCYRRRLAFINFEYTCTYQWQLLSNFSTFTLILHFRYNHKWTLLIFFMCQSKNNYFIEKVWSTF